MKKPAKKTEDFLDLMTNWQGLENRTIEEASDLSATTDNPLIKAIAGIIKRESQKHCFIQQTIIESTTKEAAHMSPDDLKILSAYLNKHLEAENKVLGLAEEALQKSEVFITRYLLSYLVADKRKHLFLIDQLDDELKTASIPTSASSKLKSSGEKAA